MVEVSRSGAVRSMISRHKIQQNTARIARTIGNVAVCRTFVRSVFFITTRHGDGFIDRSPQIPTADYRVGIGALPGPSYTSTSERSVRSVF
jgi:hypothetical protein